MELFSAVLAPGQISPRATKTNSKGLQTTMCMQSWGKLWARRCKKTKNPNATSEELGAKGGYSTTKGVGTPPKLPLQPNPWMHSYAHSVQGTRSPIHLHRERVSKFSAAVLAALCCSRGLDKALPEFLVWSLVHFYQLGKTKNPAW